MIIKQQKDSGPSDQLIATWNSIHFWTSTRLKMSKIFQIKLIDLFDLNILHLQSEYLHLRYIFIFEFSHECATIITLCETPNYFENRDFKRSVYCWAHWKKDVSNARRYNPCYFVFLRVLFHLKSGVWCRLTRAYHFTMLELNFLLLLLEFNFQQKYFPFVTLSVCRKVEPIWWPETETNADIIKCCTIKFCLIQATDDIECVQVENYARNVFVWTFFRICRRNLKKHQTLNK